MTLPRDIARCWGSSDHENMCSRCARDALNNNDSGHGERVVYMTFTPYVERKMSGMVVRCDGYIERKKND